MIGRDTQPYRPDIDGLRAVAVSAVIAFHAFPELLPGGFIGVDVFFVISGFLISGIILNALRSGRFSFAQFYARRIRRIFPALSIVLAVVLALGWFTLLMDDYAALGKHVVGGVGFSSNLLLWREMSYFDVGAELKPLLHLWSLGIEEQFYLLWPVLLVWSFRWRSGPLILTVSIAAASFAASIYTVRIDPTAAFYAPWTRFWELLAGAALACLNLGERVTIHRRIANALSIAGIAAIAVGVTLINPTRVFPGLWALLPVGGAALVLVAGPSAILNRLLLSPRAVAWVGLISYPLYLWHWPLLTLSRLILNGTPPAGVRALVVLASVLLAWTTYRVIESPIRFGPKRRLLVPALSAVMVLIATAGASTALSGGYARRAANLGDAGMFVEYYTRMRQHQISAAYRTECDFMDWDNDELRNELDPGCTIAGVEATYFLWGDSFAQALSLGLREVMPPGISLAQVATSGCRAAFEHYDEPGAGQRCDTSNAFAIASIKRLRPQVVVVAQKRGHTGTDWLSLSAHLHEVGVGHVIVIGPAPQWRPTLPRIFALNYLKEPRAYVSEGLDQAVLAEDRQMSAMLAHADGLTYVSLIAHLCREDGCLAGVPGLAPTDLMTFDFGHLTPQGSSHVGREVLKPYLERAAR
ncbi:MAG: acyltransferase family protein [Vicinamibacterales bacterium]